MRYDKDSSVCYFEGVPMVCGLRAVVHPKSALRSRGEIKVCLKLPLASTGLEGCDL